MNLYCNVTTNLNLFVPARQVISPTEHKGDLSYVCLENGDEKVKSVFSRDENDDEDETLIPAQIMEWYEK